MSIPEQLSEAIRQSREALLSNSRNDLELGYRHLIWAAMGPRAPEPDPEAESGEPEWNEETLLGKLRRASLAILSTRKVLPFWETVFPADPLPQRALSVAANVLEGSVGWGWGWYEWERMDQYHDQINNETPEEEIQQALAAGLAAIQALRASVADETFHPDRVDLSLTEGKIYPVDLDSSYCASSAWANGTIWSPISNDLKRKEFWLWWLDEAVPKAWNVSSPEPPGED